MLEQDTGWRQGEVTLLLDLGWKDVCGERGDTWLSVATVFDRTVNWTVHQKYSDSFTQYSTQSCHFEHYQTLTLSFTCGAMYTHVRSESESPTEAQAYLETTMWAPGPACLECLGCDQSGHVCLRVCVCVCVVTLLQLPVVSSLSHRFSLKEQSQPDSDSSRHTHAHRGWSSQWKELYTLFGISRSPEISLENDPWVIFKLSLIFSHWTSLKLYSLMKMKDI